jgi:multicomponent Na+:H+ antiporter subunit A
VNRARSLILDVGVRTVFHTGLLLSFFFLFSGHNAPGGGFVGGLVAGAAFVLQDVATGFDASLRRTVVDPESVLGFGLLIAVVTGLVALISGAEFLESVKVSTTLPLIGTVKATSALVFDVGVYLVVLGVVLTIVERLGEEPEA